QMLVDGWSLPPLFEEFLSLYRALSEGRDLELPRPRPFRDYIAWLRRQDLEAAEAFWRQSFAGFTEPTPIPMDRPTAAPRIYAEAFRFLPAAATETLQAFARRHRLTLNSLVQGAWAELLARRGGVSDVLFGVTVSGRPADLPGVEDMVGLFINTLPFRARCRQGQVLPWLQGVQDQLSRIRQFEYTPLAEIQRWVGSSHGSLFDSFLVFQNYPLESGSAAGGEGGTEALGAGGTETEERSTYALTLVVYPGEELVLDLEYDAARFDATTVERQLRHLEHLLADMAARPEANLENLSLLSPAEAHQLRVEWRSPAAAATPETLSLHGLVAAQAERTPDAMAVLCGDTALTYAELRRRAGA
ncbi:MAG: non-ribosomal peptide synthetase, partial [Acidobacteria bacterium]|nr:non-ribosomal peptide synthetase [Acidobacteriota bacterium]